MIMNLLDISTRYLPEHEMDALTSNFPGLESTGLRVVPQEYGCFVSVPEDWRDLLDADGMERLYPNVARLLDYAVANGCYWILFDANGNDIGGTLPDGSEFPNWD